MHFFNVFSCFQLLSVDQTESRRKQEKRRQTWSDIPPRTKNPKPEVDPTFLPPTVTSPKWRQTEKNRKSQTSHVNNSVSFDRKKIKLGGWWGVSPNHFQPKDQLPSLEVQKLWHTKVQKTVFNLFFSATGNTMTRSTNRCWFHLCWRPTTIPLAGKNNYKKLVNCEQRKCHTYFNPQNREKIGY